MPKSSESPQSGDKQRPKANRARRWFQFGLRALIGVMTLAAIAAGIWKWYTEPFRRQRLAMAAIEKAGGSYKTTAAGPAWLRRVLGEGQFQDITLVNAADCDEPAAYLDHVASLPAVETIVAGGPAFTDDHLWRLHGISTLRGLVLDCTEVTKPGLAAVTEARPKLEVYQSQRRAIAAIQRLGGKVKSQANTSHAALSQTVGLEWFEEANDVKLWRTQVTNAELVHLKWLTQLEWAFVEHSPISDDGLIHLQGLTNLKGVLLASTNVGDAGLKHLEALPNLATLRLTGTQVTDAGLAQLRGMSRLCTLVLDGTKVSDAGLGHLQALPNLGHLNLSRTQVSDIGLAQLGRFSNLMHVDLDGTRVTDGGVAHLRGLNHLTYLSLVDTQVTDRGLAQLTSLSRLGEINLSGTKITDAGLAHVKQFSQLWFLRLVTTQVSDAGLAHVKELKNLKQLQISGKVTPSGVDELRRALPNCDVQLWPANWRWR